MRGDFAWVELYSTAEVFVRELVQNALDAPTMLGGSSPRPRIRVELDARANTIGSGVSA